MIDKLYNEISKFRTIPAQAVIKKSLFIINFDKDQNSSEKPVIQTKQDKIGVVENLEPRYVKI